MRKFQFLVITAIFFAATLISFSNVPDWWIERGAVSANSDESSQETKAKNFDYATVGQLMHIASKAKIELDEKVEGGAGIAINNMVGAFSPYNSADPLKNYAYANVGQLKNVAQKFFDRLYELPSGGVIFPSCMSDDDIAMHKYPWADSSETSSSEQLKQNYDLITIGQLKNMFSWSINSEITLLADSDGDGIPDAIENMYGGDWEHSQSARFIVLQAQNGNIRYGEDGVALAEPLIVKAIDEKGNAISSVPLSVSSNRGSFVTPQSYITDANGICSISFTPNFENIDTNSVNIGISNKPYQVAFTIKKQSINETFSQDNLLSSKLIQKDPEYQEEENFYLGIVGRLPIKVDEERVVTVDGGCLCERNELPSGNFSHSGGSAYYIKENRILSGIYLCACGVEYGFNYFYRTSSYRFSYDQTQDRAKALMQKMTISNFESRYFYTNGHNGTLYMGPHANSPYGNDDFEKYGQDLKFYLEPSHFYADGCGASNGEVFCPEMCAYCSEISRLDWQIKPWVGNIRVSDFNGFNVGHVGTIRSFGSIDLDGGYDVVSDLDPNASGYRQKVVILSLENATNLSLDGSSLIGSKASKATGILRVKGYILEWKNYWDYYGLTENTQSWKQISDDTYKIEIDPPKVPFSVPMSESAGPRYRKISLSGRPISDTKPQQENEDDIEASETYVDALSLGLKHDFLDIPEIKVPSSDLVLSLKRSYVPLVWNLKSGLRPNEKPESAFGGNWNTNAVTYACVETQLLDDESKRTSPDTATIVDENGSPFSFAYVNNKFFSMPSGRSEKQSYLNHASKDGENIVLNKKFGTKITYEPVNRNITVAANRMIGSKDFIQYNYYRAVSVEDKFGNGIIYEYPDSNTLVPSRIYVRDHQDISISFEQQNGYITKAWDCEGNSISYTYSTLTVLGDKQTNPDIPLIPLKVQGLVSSIDCNVLTKVQKSGIDIVSYNYGEIDAQIDEYAIKSGGYLFYNFNLYLNSLTDATLKTYSFEYDGSLGLYSFDNEVGYYIGNNRPLPISKVILPDGSFSTFSSDSNVKLSAERVLNSGNVLFSLQEVGKRKTIISDADGNKLVYTWLDTANSDNIIQAELLKDFSEMYDVALEDDFTNPINIYFPYMRIDHYEGSGEGAQLLGSETFEFDIDAGMALKKVTDFSGNITEYEYNDSISESDPRKEVGYAAKFSDPTKETRYVGGQAQSKEFSYSPNYRIMDSMTDELGRVTKWTVDEFGRRTAERIYASVSDAASLQNAVKETLFTYDATFKGFLSETLIKDGAGSGKDMLSRNVPDSNGRLASTIIDPDGLAITTSYQYNRNGKKTLQTDANGNSSAFEYDAFSRLTKRINPDGTENLISYDAAGRKISETNENGVVTNYAYNQNGLRTHTTILMSDSSDNISTVTSYSSAGKILSSTDGNGNLTTFEYDGMGRLLKMTKYEGSDTSENGTSYVTTYTYTGNCGSGAFSTDNFKPSTVTDARGNISIFTHDALYRETSIKLPYGQNGSTTYYTYDAVGNKISETDALGNVTQYLYDAQNNLVQSTFADNSQTSATYSSAGLLLSQTDEMSATTSFEYDLAGRKVKTIYPQVSYNNSAVNPEEEYLYDKNGNLTTRIDQMGKRWDTVYDTRNRVIAQIAPAIIDARQSTKTYVRPTTQSVYDKVGNVVKSIDPNGNETDTAYDNANRAVCVTFPTVEVGADTPTSPSQNLRPQELRTYDKNGNVISATNPRGIVTETSYNSFNKPVQVVKNATASNANDKITESLSYDANGNLELITDGNGNKTKYVYDAMNRRMSAIYGFESTTTRTDNFEYDTLNMTNRKGVSLTYDARNRLATEGGSSRIYTYDLCGRILSVNGSPSPNANVLYVYDALGRLISEKNGSRTHFYEYDLANRRIKSFYGSESSIFENSSISHSLATQYNTNGKIEKLIDQQGRTTTYAYDPNGNVVKKTNPNGYILTNSYDALNRVRSKNCEDVKYDYYYDLGGNIIRFYEWNKRGVNIMSSWDSILVYDAFDRLVSETLYDTNTIYITTYTYDSNGNRLTKRLQKGLESEGESNRFEENYEYAVNSLNQVVGVTKRRWVLSNPEVVETTTSAITYNVRGNANLISSSDGKSTEFNYDEFDMIVSARDYDSGNTISSSTNIYDYRGRRVEHGCQSSSFDYEKVYSYSDGTSVVESRLDLNDRSERKTLFYRGSDQGGGVGGINYSEFADGTDLNYKFYNLRGDVVLTIDGNSNVSSKYLYFGFGKNVLERGSEIATDKHRANTKVEDESSLLNEGKRFRHLELDIFLTPDPLEYIDGYNPYIYVNQNPWGRWDPLGLEATVETTSGTGVVRVCNSMIETYAAISVTRQAGETPESAKKSAYLAVKVTIMSKNIEAKSVIVATPVKINDDGSSNEQYVRLFLQDHVNRLEDTSKELDPFMNIDEPTTLSVTAEYSFISGKMGTDFSPSNIIVNDTDKDGKIGGNGTVINHKDSTFYAQDGMNTYRGNDPSKIMNSENKFDGGTFKIINKIDAAKGSNSVNVSGTASGVGYRPSNEGAHQGSVTYNGGDEK